MTNDFALRASMTNGVDAANPSFVIKAEGQVIRHSHQES